MREESGQEKMSSCIKCVLILILTLCGVSMCHRQPMVGRTKKLQPVIIDTDIGSYIDDTFAIAYAIQSKKLDVKLIVTCSGDTTARAKIAAKLLRLIGRDDIPIGIGINNTNKTDHTLFNWAKDEDLSKYNVSYDGIKMMGETILESKDMIDIIAIGPMTNFPTLHRLYPESVNRSRIKIMAGSIRRGYYGSPVISREYNVISCTSCMQIVLNSGWDITMTPLDTCGDIALLGKDIKHILEGGSSVSLALSSSLMYYCINAEKEVCNLRSKTPILYDVVAVLLALQDEAAEFLVFKNMPITVNGTGFTVVDPNQGVFISVALFWKDNDGRERSFIDSLINVLT